MPRGFDRPVLVNLNEAALVLLGSVVDQRHDDPYAEHELHSSAQTKLTLFDLTSWAVVAVLCLTNNPSCMYRRVLPFECSRALGHRAITSLRGPLVHSRIVPTLRRPTSQNLTCSVTLICTAATSIANLDVRVDSASSEEYRSGVVNLPYDFGKKMGRKLWEAWVAATGTGSIRKPRPMNVIAWTCATSTGRVCSRQGDGSLCAGRGPTGRQAPSRAE
jgi:hypothetical protein